MALQYIRLKVIENQFLSTDFMKIDQSESLNFIKKMRSPKSRDTTAAAAAAASADILQNPKKYLNLKEQKDEALKKKTILLQRSRSKTDDMDSCSMNNGNDNMIRVDIKKKKIYPELKNVKLPEKIDVDFNDENAVRKKQNELAEAMFQELLFEKENIVKKNKFGVTNDEVKELLFNAQQTYRASLEYENNGNVFSTEELEKKYAVSNQKFYDSTTKILSKMHLISDEFKTNPEEFTRKTMAINTSIYIYRKIKEDYAETFEKMHKYKDTAEIIQELQNLDTKKEGKFVPNPPYNTRGVKVLCEAH